MYMVTAISSKLIFPLQNIKNCILKYTIAYLQKLKMSYFLLDKKMY